MGISVSFAKLGQLKTTV